MSTKAMQETSSESIQADRDTLRTLLIVSLSLLASIFVSPFLVSIPDEVQMALNLEEEMIWDSRSGLFGVVIVAVFLALLVTMVWAYVDLWRYRRQGVTKVASVVFFPLFLVAASPTCSPPLVEYLVNLYNVVTGMILFHCWTNPELFNEQAPAAAKAGTASGLNASPSSGAGSSVAASPAR